MSSSSQKDKHQIIILKDSFCNNWNHSRWIYIFKNNNASSIFFC